MMWICRICKKKFEHASEITRHIFLEHTNEAIILLPIQCFEMIGDLFLKEFIDLWKTVICKEDDKPK